MERAAIIIGAVFAAVVPVAGVFWLLVTRIDDVDARFIEEVKEIRAMISEDVGGAKQEFREEDRQIRDTFRAEDSTTEREIQALENELKGLRERLADVEARQQERATLIERFIDKEFAK